MEREPQPKPPPTEEKSLEEQIVPISSSEEPSIDESLHQAILDAQEKDSKLLGS